MPGHRKIDHGRAIAMRAKGKSYQEIADSFGVTKTTAHRVVTGLLQKLPTKTEIQVMRETMADHLTVEAYKAVVSMSDEDRAKASLKDKALTAAVLIDKHRLITGQSTQNIAVMMAKAVVEAQEQFDAQESLDYLQLED